MYGLSDKIVKEIIEIKNKYKIEIMVFGSRVKGTFKDNSDIDLAVLTKVMDNIKYKIMDDFDNIDTCYKIDLVFIQNINNTEFLEEIMKEGNRL